MVHWLSGHCGTANFGYQLFVSKAGAKKESHLGDYIPFKPVSLFLN